MNLTKKDETVLSYYNFSNIFRYWHFSDQ